LIVGGLSGISGPMAVDLGASGALEDPAGLRVTKGPVSAHVSQMISTEFVVNCDIEDQVAVAAEVDVLDHQFAPPHLAVALLDGRPHARCRLVFYDRPVRGDVALVGGIIMRPGKRGLVFFVRSSEPSHTLDLELQLYRLIMW